MTVDGVIVENMQNYDTLLLKEGIFYFIGKTACGALLN